MSNVVTFAKPVHPRVKAEIGTVIHGTLRPRDLLKAYADELARLAGLNFDHVWFATWCAAAAKAKMWIELHSETEIWHEEADELIGELADHLDDFAPEGCAFGAHEGDGSDFGFWPCVDLV